VCWGDDLSAGRRRPSSFFHRACYQVRLSLEPSSIGFKRRSLRSLEPGLNFSVEHTGESGAALTTRHDSYNEDAQLDMRFRKYTKLHYESWVEFARLKEYGENLRPVLVSGFDMTKDFAMMAYSNSNTSVQAGADCHTPMFGSASASTEFTWRTVCAPHFKDGPKERRPPGLRPSQASAGTPPTEYNQCIFVRYYTMRSEFGIFPRVIRAAAGPKDLGSGENRGETFPELTVRSGAGPVSAERDPGEQWSLATDDTGSEPDMVIRNEPYVWFFACPCVSALTLPSRMKIVTVGISLQTTCPR
jgi:hypothetical protein